MNITQTFYDNLASQYDKLFQDWQAMTAEQAGIMEALFKAEGFDRTACILDCACGIANPKAEICAFMDGAWLRVSCELVEDDRVEARKSMLDAYPNLRAMYDENDGNTQVLYLKNAVATLSSFTSAPETWTF